MMQEVFGFGTEKRMEMREADIAWGDLDGLYRYAYAWA